MKHCSNPACSYLLEYGRPAEYEAQVDECLDCGAPLRDGPRPERPEETVPATGRSRGEGAGDLVEVGVFGSAAEAQMALAWLRETDIPAVVTDESGARVLSSMAGERIHVRVPAEHARRAAEILEDLRDSEVDEEFFDEEGDDALPDDDRA